MDILNKLNEIDLNRLKLKTFTEQDVLDYCQINNIDPDDIIKLYLSDNELTDISGIKLFKNLKILYLDSNNISDISVLKDLNNLIELYLTNNNISDISALKNLNNLKELYLNNNNKIKNISVIKSLNKLNILSLNNNKIKNISVIKNFIQLEYLNITNLKLESDQIKYINSLKNLKRLWSRNGFKNMNILKQLNKNIKTYE